MLITREWTNRCHFGDCLEILRTMPDGIVQTCVTSPPYFGLRDYGHAGQIGLEATPDAFVGKLVEVFREVRRVLRDDGTLWLNLGDSYASTTKGSGGKGKSTLGATADGGSSVSDAGRLRSQERQSTEIRRFDLGASHLKEKDLIGIPWMVAFALRADGWYLRSSIIWAKPNPMPESVTDRPTSAHENIFLLAKSPTYYCDMGAIKEPGITGDMRRPYGSPGANELDPRGKQGEGKLRKGTDKQRGHSRRHAGFNEHWDAMSKEEQCGGLRNKRNVWTVATKPYSGAHFATFPPDLIEPCVLAGAPAGGVVLDPFFGSGTTGQVAQALGRNFIGIELNEDYRELQNERLRQPALGLEV